MTRPLAPPVVLVGLLSCGEAPRWFTSVLNPITRDDLAAGYRARAEHLRELQEEMEGISQEANEYLGDVPEWD